MRLLISLPSALLCVAISQIASAEDLFFNANEMPKVLTGTRLQQAPTAIPGSMTVIDRALIKASAARTIPEVLRLVPGIQVVNTSGYNASVNYHGGDPNHSRRMQVMIDGRSVLRAGISNVDWADLPISVEDIERIEVFRGPNTVSYGSNALFGVVNIITHASRYTHASRFKINKGTRGLTDWYLQTGTNWATGGSWLSLSGSKDDGFDKAYNRSKRASYRSGSDHTRLRWQGEQDLNEHNTIKWHTAYSKGTNYAPATLHPINVPQVVPLGGFDVNANYKNQDLSLGIDWAYTPSDSYSMQLRTNYRYWDRKREWNMCDGNAAFSKLYYKMWEKLNTTDGEPMDLEEPGLQIGIAADDVPNYPYSCAIFNENIKEQRFDMEWQNTFTLSPALRFVQGFRARHDEAKSETFFAGKVSKSLFGLFSQIEWYATDHWLLQAGLMYENDTLVGSSTTPRASINYLINPSHSLRLVYTEAVRSPDMLDMRAHWEYIVHPYYIRGWPGDNDRYFYRAYGNKNLKHERMRSYEFGYHGLFNEPAIELDAKLFHDQIRDMISQPMNLYYFNPVNNYTLTLYGFETEADWNINAQHRLRLGYTYLTNKLTEKRHIIISKGLENLSSSRHQANLAWLMNWEHGWDTSLMYFYSSNVAHRQYRQIQGRIGKSINYRSTDVNFSFNWRHLIDKPALNNYDTRYSSRTHFYFSTEIEF